MNFSDFIFSIWKLTSSRFNKKMYLVTQRKSMEAYSSAIYLIITITDVSGRAGCQIRVRSLEESPFSLILDTASLPG